MRSALRILLCLAAASAVALASAPALAQGVTTGAISGRVTDSEGGALPGATITAVHQPTGTRYVVVSRADGGYLVASARVGGPYTVTAGLEGFTTQEKTELFVSLGPGQQHEVLSPGQPCASRAPHPDVRILPSRLAERLAVLLVIRQRRHGFGPDDWIRVLPSGLRLETIEERHGGALLNCEC